MFTGIVRHDRTAQRFTDDRPRRADGWVERGRTTGVAGMPTGARLAAGGLEGHLVHARHVNTVPGQKTDGHEAVGLPPGPPHGLRRGSVRPAHALATRRASWRPRDRVLADAAAHLQPRQKALRPMQVPRHHVGSDMTGATGMKRLRAMVAGHHDSSPLAAYREVRGTASAEAGRHALPGARGASVTPRASVAGCAGAPSGAPRQRPGRPRPGRLLRALGYRLDPAAGMRGRYGLDAHRRVWPGQNALADGSPVHVVAAVSPWPPER
jgi:hypothetical protein